MILTCPRCATRYLVDEGQVWTTGRTVQCEACGQRWRATGAGAPPAPEPVVPQPAVPQAARTEPDRPRPAEPAAAARPSASWRDDEQEPRPLPAFAPLPLGPSRGAAPAAAAEEEPLAAPALFRTPKPAASPRQRPSRRGRWLAILLILAMVVGVLILGMRDAIIQAVPALAGVYSALGLSEVKFFGLGGHG